MAKIDQLPAAARKAPADDTEGLARDVMFELLRHRQGMTPQSIASEAWGIARAFKAEATDAPADTLKLKQGAG